uniref:tubulin--tyrosine ligase-like protein 12 n=1 Tax=Ciona intestinalis TaxID=7719 RepID=UPI000180B400|nr:tubulin--tyrosine ligase-like protein 12 [Ciona intestinalis]|eukprot:XP_002120682.1 tubulin--tyrosine ligase-like protein 12 [Ciona intestinalis]
MSGDSSEKLSFEQFCDIYKEVLASNGVTPHLFRALHRKLEHEIFDAGEYFSLTTDDESDGNSKLKAVLINEDGLEVSDSNGIFLIDHAWTFQPREARSQLCNAPGLLPRMAELMGYSVHGEVFNPDDDIVNDVLTEMWKYIHTYSSSAGEAEEKVPIWYLMDEFGSRIRHSDEPTVKIVPFHYQPTGTTYSLMWLTQDMEYADELTYDFAFDERDPILRKCKLLPWVGADFSDVSTHTNVLPDKSYDDRFKYTNETLPTGNQIPGKKEGKLKIFTEYHRQYLTDVKNFEIVENREEADVIYPATSIRDYKYFSEERPDVLLGMFPCEQIILCKDFFADIAKRAGKDGKFPPWHPVSFNLHSEFPQFISYFKQRENEGLDMNVWICRPWNLARGLEIQVTNNLNEIIRLRETPIPKVVSKYIEHPVLFHRDDINVKVKFDLRFNVLLTSVEPMKLYVCKVFLLRFANKEFALNNFDDYQQHYTVMNYVEGGTKLKQINYDQFIPMFEDQNPDFKWEDVERNIHRCIKEFFISATSRPAPYGIGHNQQSRAMYGIDAMLEWRDDPQTGAHVMQPVLLECNFMPENSRSCKHFPNFLNDVFRFLFRGDDVADCNVVDVTDV